MLPEPVAVALMVIEALDALGVPYLIGGSLASAVHGVARSTVDVDMVADLRTHHVEGLALALAEAFYLNPEAIHDAIHRRTSFNLIHLDSMFKVDVFVHRGRPFDRLQFERRQSQVIATDPQRTAYVASVEDTVLAKLEWYRLGGETSDRQWRDVLGVLKVQGQRLDHAYLRRWANALGLADLLEVALTEAGEEKGSK